MSEIRYYTVTRTQEVKIAAPTPLKAGELAQKVFDAESVTSGEGINVLKPVRQRTLDVSEDY